MKITISQLKKATRNLTALALMGILATACSKKNDVTPDQPDVPVETDAAVPYYKLQRVENLPDSTGDTDPTAALPPIFYSLRYKKYQPASFAKTTYWDLCMSSTYNSFLSANNNTNPTNLGYQGPGKGGIMIVAKAFDDVTDVPADAQFQTGTAVVGTDGNGAFAAELSTLGWYLYDYSGSVVGDGGPTKVHVAYALGSPLKLANGTTLAARTVILKLANGDYAKIKMISCYKDIFTSDLMLTNSPHMYFTFEYVIVPAGSTKFEIK